MKRILPVMGLFFLIVSCSEKIDNTGTCTDGVKNQGEQGIDCGGPCSNACPSCADGILNQDETAVDCGGSCDPCYPRLSAMVNDSLWYATSRNAFISAPGTIRMYGTNQLQNLTLYYSGPFIEGTIGTGTQFMAEYRDDFGNLYTSVPGGNISFSTFDTTNRIVAGIFSCQVTDTISGESLTLDNGIFTELGY